MGLSITACSWECGTARRTVASAIVQSGTDAPVGTAQVNLSDNVGPSFLRLSVAVLGPPSAGGAPLRGHVTSARLVTEAGELLAEIPIGTETLYSEAVVALNADLRTRNEYDRIRGALLTNRTKIILDTDVAGLEHLEATFADAHDEPGQLQRCSPV